MKSTEINQVPLENSQFIAAQETSLNEQQNEREWLFIQSPYNLKEGEKWPEDLQTIHKEIKKRGGIWNHELGIGWYIPQSKDDKLESFLKVLHLQYTTIKSNFDPKSLLLDQTKSYHENRMATALDNIKALSGIAEYNIAQPLTDNLKNNRDIVKHHQTYLEHQSKKRAIEVKEAARRFLASSLEIYFIKDQKVNFFTKNPPDAPRLLYTSERGSRYPFIQRGIVGQVIGAGGIGKTHLLAQLAVSIATNKLFLNKYHVESTGYVFIGLGEDKHDDMHRLLYKHAHGLSDEQKKMAAKHIAAHSFHGFNASLIIKDEPTPFFNNFLNMLKKLEPSEGWSLIILDPASRFLGADAENDNASATRFIELLERITLELKGNPTVIFGHHKNKSGLKEPNSDQSAARGSSALTDGVRWQANLDPVFIGDEIDRSRIRFRVVKSNLTPPQDPITLTKDANGVLIYDENYKEEQGKSHTHSPKSANLKKPQNKNNEEKSILEQLEAMD